MFSGFNARSIKRSFRLVAIGAGLWGVVIKDTAVGIVTS
jgi:hypothetical protein